MHQEILPALQSPIYLRFRWKASFLQLIHDTALNNQEMKHSEVIRYLERKTDSSRFFLVSNHGGHKEVVCHFFKSCLFWRLYNVMIDWHIHKEMINTIKLINIPITSYNYLFLWWQHIQTLPCNAKYYYIQSQCCTLDYQKYSSCT